MLFQIQRKEDDMNITIANFNKEKVARSLAGFSIVILLIIQELIDVDLTILFYAIGLNLFQYGITGWCPIAFYFKRIGWIKDY